MSEAIGPEAIWRAALSEGRFLLQKSKNSGDFVFPPRAMMPGSGTDDLEWVPASGFGTVYSVTIISPKPPVEPYNVALIQLDEGPRIMSRVDNIAPDAVKIGIRVRARIATNEGEAILLFDAD